MFMRFFIIILLFSLITGCGKDESEDVFVSGKTPNWREVKDEPGAINQLRYKIYKDYDVSIAVSDTLGKEFRGFDINGDSIIHYEILPLGYTMTGNVTEKMGRTLSRNEEALLKALELMEKYVAPKLPQEGIYRPYVYLLCDSMYREYTTYYGQVNYALWTSKTSIMNIEIGKVAQLLEMNEVEQRFWAGMALASTHSKALYEIYEEDLEAFYDISVDEKDKSLYNSLELYTNGQIPENRDEEMYSYGFLEDQYRGWYNMGAQEYTKNYAMVQYSTQIDDIQCYMAAVYAFEEEEFIQLLGDTSKYAKILQKYRIMKELLTRFRTEVAP